MLVHDGFDVVENADGTWTMLDVPVFFECERGDDRYDAGWIGAAFDRLREWEGVGHFPPITIGHRRRDNPEPEGAGWFKATRVGDFEGRKAIFADLVLNERAWREVSAKRLPYRSVESTMPSRDEEPEIDSLALLENAPYLKMPMTIPKGSRGVTGATAARVTAPAGGATLSPVMAFAAYGGRCQIFSEAPMRKRKFEADKPGDAEPKGDAAPAAPPKPADEAKGATGMSEAVQKISDLAATPVPLQDVPAVIRLLEEKLAALKGAMRPADTDDDHDDDDDEEGPGAGVKPSDDTSEPDGSSKPPANGKEPMNMSADNSTKAGPVDAEAMARFAAENAALRGRMDAFEAEQKRERAIFAAVKDLADYNIGGEPEAVIRDVVKDAGDAWEKTLQIFSAHTKKVAPKRGRQVGSGSLPESDADLYPPEVAALGCKTPEDGAIALRCFAAWKQNSGGVPFDAFHKYNAKHFGALAVK